MCIKEDRYYFRISFNEMFEDLLMARLSNRGRKREKRIKKIEKFVFLYRKD